MATQEQLTHIKDVFMRLGDALNLKDSARKGLGGLGFRVELD